MTSPPVNIFAWRGRGRELFVKNSPPALLVAMGGDFFKIFGAHIKAEFDGLVGIFGGLVVIALFKPREGQIVPRGRESGLLFNGLFADFDALVVLAVHVVGSAESRHRLNEFGIPFQGLLQGADGLFGLAALQMHKADVAPRHGELGAAIGRFLIVAQAAFEIAALQTDAAKLHVGFGKMGRIADRGEKRFFRRHKVALAEQGLRQDCNGDWRNRRSG